jgi:hypothetical protein
MGLREQPSTALAPQDGRQAPVEPDLDTVNGRTTVEAHASVAIDTSVRISRDMATLGAARRKATAPDAPSWSA